MTLQQQQCDGKTSVHCSRTATTTVSQETAREARLGTFGERNSNLLSGTATKKALYPKHVTDAYRRRRESKKSQERSHSKQTKQRRSTSKEHRQAQAINIQPNKQNKEILLKQCLWVACCSSRHSKCAAKRRPKPLEEPSRPLLPSA